MKEFDAVILLENLNIIDYYTSGQVELLEGQIGTIIEIFNNEKSPSYEVEFLDKNGKNIAVVNLKSSQIKLDKKFNNH